MHLPLLAASALVTLTGSAAIGSPEGSTPEGEWKTFDDRTGAPRALVRISMRDGQLAGVIERIFPRPGEPMDPVCARCGGPRRNQRVVGMEVLSGHRRERDRWTGGRILDPENGKEYSSAVWLAAPDELRVRGYWGPFHRTQVWRRVGPREGRP